MSVPQMQGVAGGDIRTCRFIKISTAADHTFLEADANEWTAGISDVASQDNPATQANAYAASALDSFRFYTDGEICLLELADTVTRAGRIKSDADGCGVPVLTTGTTEQLYGAEALESGVTGEKIRVRIVRGRFYPALA